MDRTAAITSSIEFLVQSRCGLATTTLESSSEFAKFLQFSYEALYLEFLLPAESCYPLLTERWRFSTGASTEDSQELSECPKILPQHRKQTYSLSLNAPRYSWHNSLGKKDILQLGFSGTGKLGITVEYFTRSVYPEIKVQELGARQRLTSLEEPSFFDTSESEGSYLSSQEPLSMLIPDLTQELQPALITSKCHNEHSSMGFSPLSHTICNEEAEDILGSDEFSDTTLENGNWPEDTEICLYWKHCGKMHCRLFEDNVISPWNVVDSILIEMRGLRELGSISQ